ALTASNDGFNEVDPARTSRFVKIVARVEQSGFSLASLTYLFSDLSHAPRELAPSDESIQLVLTTVREGLARIAGETRPSDDPTGEVTRGRLGLLFEPHTVEQIAGLLAGTTSWTLSVESARGGKAPSPHRAIFSAPLAVLPASVAPLPTGKVNHE